MHAMEYRQIKNVGLNICAEFRYPTINMLGRAVKIQINGLFMSGMFPCLMYLYTTRGSVINMAINPIIKNMNPISSTACECDVIAAMVIPTNTIQYVG